MEAQQKTNTAIGEYYLSGVMETASGFKLNPDSTFQFFFSYGALDRSGSGTWKQEGNNIIFNSKAGTNGFALVNSNTVNNDRLTIKITDANPFVPALLLNIILFPSCFQVPLPLRSSAP